MELLPNIAPEFAFAPKSNIELSDVGGKTVQLNTEVRMIQVGARGRYQVVNGSYAGTLITLDWQSGKNLLQPLKVWRPSTCAAVKNLDGGSFAYHLNDRLVHVRGQEYLVTSGPNIGKRVRGKNGLEQLP